MLQYFDTLTDDSGNSLLGATVTVFNYPSGTLAAVYSTNGTANPVAASTVVADITGQISFYVPDGVYSLTYVYKGSTYKVRSPVQLLDPTGFVALQDTGAANAYVITDARLPAQLYTGFKIEFKAANANTGGAATLNINGTGAVALVQPGGSTLSAGMIRTNGLVRAEYDGTSFQLYGAFNQVFYDISAGETAAGATIVNGNYPYGYVDRYGTNLIPGTTDMAAAFNMAYKVAKQTGCSVYWGATAPYRLNSPVNCTAMRGIVSWDQSSKNLSAVAPSVIIAHDGATSSHGFDLSASTEMTFNNVVGANLAGKTPNCLFFLARNSLGSGAGFHNFNKCSTVANAAFKFCIYGYGSEENNFNGCVLYNTAPAGYNVSHNGTNPSGYTSAFLTIATLAQSNTVNRHWGFSYFNTGNSGSGNEVTIDLENSSDFTARDGIWGNAHGLATMNVRGTAGSQGVSLKSIRAEPLGTQAAYGILVNSSAGVHSNWDIANVACDTSRELLYIDDNTSMQTLDMDAASSCTSGKKFNAKNASNCRIAHFTSTIVGRAGGAISNCAFIGSRSQITFSGTDTQNSGFDTALGTVWETGDSYTAPSTACTGALTAAVIWSLTKRSKMIIVTLPATTGAASAAASFNYGAAIPAAYRPSADRRIPLQIQDNSNVLNQLGFVFISAATGVMTVFKDQVGTANFTAAAGAGVPSGMSPSFNTA